MCRVLKLEIKETEAELESLSGFERIQVLYLLKTHKTSSVQHLAAVVGRRRITIHRWLKHYRAAGLEGLLEKRKSPGRPKIIPV
ncbi:helix-turn-helix domain-containing protein, partial [Brasilonema sp. CT11]|nr:helix-turn-helix domain-containing protein [Brasilonema sp. CT11]